MDTMRRGQVSMEYMMVVGFSLLLLLPIIAVYGLERQNMDNQITAKQADTIARKVADSAETVYYLGKPARTTLKVYMPKNIVNVSIDGREVVFVVRMGKGLSDVVGTSDVNMTGTITTRQGIQYIELTADDNVVNVTTI
jgi:uncharacterized protein (UPF0333 family)